MKPSKRAAGTVFQRKDNGRWVARVTLPDGKRVERTVPVTSQDPKRDAEHLLAHLLTTPDLAPPAPHTVATWLDEYLIRDARGKAASTAVDRKNLSKGVKAGLGRVRLDKLTPAMVQRWADSQDGSHRGRLKRLQLLRAALNQAMILGHVSRNVAAPIKLERQPTPQVAQAWTAHERDAFLTANHGAPHEHLWRLGLHTGARIGELLALRIEDYDPHARTLQFRRTVKTSGENRGRRDVGPPKTPSSVRTFPLSRTAQQIIEDQLRRRVARPVPTWSDEGWLFPNMFGALLNYNHVHQAWKAALKRAPVKPIRLHDMRTTFISLALRRGAKQEVVAKIVGHKDSTITMRIYRQVYGDEVDDVRDLLDDL